MEFYANNKLLVVFLLTFALICFLLAAEIVYIKFNGTPVAVPVIPRHPQTLGAGEQINYAILGDSTAVGQGGNYSKGIVLSSAEFMARDYRVTYQNFAVSGARFKEVVENQVPQAVRTKPDLVLIAAGANDVTHLTPIKDIETYLAATIDSLRLANPAVSIVLTGSPEMGSVPRFPQPIKYLAHKRTKEVNAVIARIAARLNVELAPIAKETGPIFMKNPQLFAQDKFHPNNDGYNLWKPVINQTIANILKEKT